MHYELAQLPDDVLLPEQSVSGPIGVIAGGLMIDEQMNEVSGSIAGLSSWGKASTTCLWT
jgi:hypothetical protein